MKLLSPSLSMALLSAALVMAASTQATAQEYTFTTLAGPTDVGGSDADGTGSAARFKCPEGVAVDSAGNVYVAKRGHPETGSVNEIVIFTGRQSTVG